MITPKSDQQEANINIEVGGSGSSSTTTNNYYGDSKPRNPVTGRYEKKQSLRQSLLNSAKKFMPNAWANINVSWKIPISIDTQQSYVPLMWIIPGDFHCPTYHSKTSPSEMLRERYVKIGTATFELDLNAGNFFVEIAGNDFKKIEVNKSLREIIDQDIGAKEIFDPIRRKLEEMHYNPDNVYVEKISLEGPSVEIGAQFSASSKGGKARAQATGIKITLLTPKDKNSAIQFDVSFTAGIGAGLTIGNVATKKGKPGVQKKIEGSFGAWKMKIFEVPLPYKLQQLKLNDNHMFESPNLAKMKMQETSSKKQEKQVAPDKENAAKNQQPMSERVAKAKAQNAIPKAKEKVKNTLKERNVNPENLQDHELAITEELIDEENNVIKDGTVDNDEGASKKQKTEDEKKKAALRAYDMIDNLSKVGNSFAELGRITQNKELERSGEVTRLSMYTLTQGLELFHEMGGDASELLSTIGFATGGIAKIIGFAVPLAGVILGVCSLASMLFVKNKTQNPDNGLALAFNHIFQTLQQIKAYLVEMHKDLKNTIYWSHFELRELLLINYNKQIEILNTILNESKKIIGAIERLEIKVDTHPLAELDEAIDNAIKEWVDEKEDEAYKAINKIVFWLTSRLTQFNHVDASSVYNGEVDYKKASSNKEVSTLYHQSVNSFFHSTRHVNQIGFLYHLYVDEREESGQHIPKELYELKKYMPNLSHWLNTFEEIKPILIDPKFSLEKCRLDLRKIKKIPAATQQFIDFIKNDTDFLTYHKNSYENAVTQIEELIHQQLIDFDSEKGGSEIKQEAIVNSVFGHANPKKEKFIELIEKAEFHKNIWIAFNLLIGNFEELLKYQHLLGDVKNSIMQSPLFYNDPLPGPDWINELHNAPQYYETFQMGKFRQENGEKVYMAIRNINGIDLRIYNPNDQSWFTASPNTAWSDAAGFGPGTPTRYYHQTFKSAAIENEIYFVMREPTGICLYSYSTLLNTWKELAKSSQTPQMAQWFLDKDGWNHISRSLPTNLIATNDKKLLLLLNPNNGHSPILLRYSPDSNKWEYVPRINKEFSTFSDNEPCFSSFKLNALSSEPWLAVFSARNRHGTPYFQFIPKMHNFLARQIKDSEFATPSHYLVTETEAMMVAGCEYFFIALRTSAGLQVYQTNVTKVKQVMEPKPGVTSYSQEKKARRLINERATGIIPNPRACEFHNIDTIHAASIRIKAAKIYGHDKLLVVGQSSVGFLLCAVDPDTMEWQKLASFNIFTTFDMPLAVSLRIEVVTLKDGTQELILSGMESNGVNIYRFPLSVKPLTKYLTSPVLNDEQVGINFANENFPTIKARMESIQEQIQEIEELHHLSPAEERKQNEYHYQEDASTSWGLPGTRGQIIEDSPTPTSAATNVHASSIFMNSMLVVGKLLEYTVQSLSFDFNLQHPYVEESPGFTKSVRDILSDYASTVNDQMIFLHLVFHRYLKFFLPSNQTRALTNKERRSLCLLNEHVLDSLKRWDHLKEKLNTTDEDIIKTQVSINDSADISDIPANATTSAMLHNINWLHIEKYGFKQYLLNILKLDPRIPYIFSEINAALTLHEDINCLNVRLKELKKHIHDILKNKRISTAILSDIKTIFDNATKMLKTYETLFEIAFCHDMGNKEVRSNMHQAPDLSTRFPSFALTITNSNNVPSHLQNSRGKHYSIRNKK